MTTNSPLTRRVIFAVCLPIIFYTLWRSVSRRWLTPGGLLDWAALEQPAAWTAVTLYFVIGALALSLYTLAFVSLVFGR